MRRFFVFCCLIAASYAYAQHRLGPMLLCLSRSLFCNPVVIRLTATPGFTRGVLCPRPCLTVRLRRQRMPWKTTSIAAPGTLASTALLPVIPKGVNWRPGAGRSPKSNLGTPSRREIFRASRTAL
jgi:hypothetical protein